MTRTRPFPTSCLLFRLVRAIPSYLTLSAHDWLCRQIRLEQSLVLWEGSRRPRKAHRHRRWRRDDHLWCVLAVLACCGRLAKSFRACPGGWDWETGFRDVRAFRFGDSSWHRLPDAGTERIWHACASRPGDGLYVHAGEDKDIFLQGDMYRISMSESSHALA